MIVGVNDESQIANKELAKDRRVQMHMIKPRMNVLSEELRSDEAKKIIGTSSIIILFGMSIGATDKDWWKCIAQRMKASESCQLIIIDYIPDLDPAFPYEVAAASEVAIEKFLSMTEITDAEKNVIRRRISAFYNTDMFKLNMQVDPLKIEKKSDIA